MTDKALQNAEAKRNQLLERKKALRVEMDSVDLQLSVTEVFIANWHEFASADPESPVENLTVTNENIAGTTQAVKRKTTRNSKKEDVAEAAREIALERGAPIMRDELYDLLTARGLVIEGKDPQMVLSTMLWRVRDKVARVKGGGYWPADIPNAEVGYDPSTAQEMDGVLNTPEGEIADADVAKSEFDDDVRMSDMRNLI
jgi:hypothetical protein